MPESSKRNASERKLQRKPDASSSVSALSPNRLGLEKSTNKVMLRKHVCSNRGLSEKLEGTNLRPRSFTGQYGESDLWRLNPGNPTEVRIWTPAPVRVPQLTG